MIWFSEDVLTTEMIFENYLSRLMSIPIDEGDEDSMSLIPQPLSAAPGSVVDQFMSPSLQVYSILLLNLKLTFYIEIFFVLYRSK